MFLCSKTTGTSAVLKSRPEPSVRRWESTLPLRAEKNAGRIMAKTIIDLKDLA
jgi:hypothetical protein